MGAHFTLVTMRGFQVAAVVLLSAAAASADWTGNGKMTCYGHMVVDSDIDEGSTNHGAGTLNCNPVEWDGDTGLGPEAIFVETSSDSFEIWAWDYHPSWGFGDVMPTGTCTGDMWYRSEDMGGGFCTPHKTEKNWSGCGLAQ